MKILDLAKGKKIIIKTDVGVEVELEISEIKEIPHSQDLAPATRENDWYPPSRDWKTYRVYFTNGYNKEYSSLHSIEFKD